jgi:hypothetical protein
MMIKVFVVWVMWRVSYWMKCDKCKRRRCNKMVGLCEVCLLEEVEFNF